MATINELLKKDNIERAWRWIRSNPDATYKSYFRDLYSIYAIADKSLLDDLRNRLKRSIYEPSHAIKIFFPKPSGILRPYTLLNIQDQIVYQAAMNVIAEKLYPKIRHRYYKDTFGHLYAGKKSIWFYRKWSNGYSKFNNAVREVFKSGFVYAASFDLTACYDSIDHCVLKHFLREIKCDTEFCDILLNLLNKWTATDHRVYHNHGIPQGPLSSGLLSEVVLKHFDEKREKSNDFAYFRYVDDIRLFAKNEYILRRILVRLDQLSKDIGLFPQSSKISIHKIKNIEDELKSISQPSEKSISKKTVDQKKLHKRIVALSPRHKVENPTRFKYLLAHATPNSKLTNRLWRIYEKAPEYYINIARYLEQYKSLPGKTSGYLINEIQSHTLYYSIIATFIKVTNGRLSSHDVRLAEKTILQKWKPSTSQADLLASVGRWLINYDLLPYNKLQYAFKTIRSWWSKAQILLTLDDRLIGKPSLETIINILLRDNSEDVAIAAAFKIYQNSLSVTPPQSNLHPSAAKILKDFGIIKRGPRQICGIKNSFHRMVSSKENVNWKTYFGKDYSKAEKQIIVCRALAETNITAWINAMDVFNDWLLISLYRNDSSLGIYKAIGSVMNSKRLKKKYPSIQAMIKSIHHKRYESNLSHAKQKRTGQPTQRIKYSYLKQAKPVIRAAISEISTKW